MTKQALTFSCTDPNTPEAFVRLLCSMLVEKLVSGQQRDCP